MKKLRSVTRKLCNFLKRNYQKHFSLISEVPDKKNLLHGDYHTNNLMVTEEETLLIDMDTLCYGDPVFEFGSVYNAYQGFSDIDHHQIETFLGFTYSEGRRVFLETLQNYYGTKDSAFLLKKEKQAKLVGYTRLLRRSIKRNTGEENIAFYKAELLTLLTEVDSLID